MAVVSSVSTSNESEIENDQIIQELRTRKDVSIGWQQDEDRKVHKVYLPRFLCHFLSHKLPLGINNLQGQMSKSGFQSCAGYTHLLLDWDINDLGWEAVSG